MSRIVRVPTNKLALAILACCRQRDPGEPERFNDLLWFRWAGIAGGAAQVGIDPDDHELLAHVRRAGKDPRAMVELAAILAAASELHDDEGAWRLERVAELLWGPRRTSSHRARELVPLRRWLRLLSEGSWEVDAPVADKPQKHKTRDPDRHRAYGGRALGSLLSIDHHNAVSATLRLSPAVAAALRDGPGAIVPVSTFDLRSPKGWTNGGAKPSRAMLTRLRLAAVLVAKFHPKGVDSEHAQAVTLNELVDRWAALDAGRITRRRQWAQLLDAVVGDLRLQHDAEGVGLDAFPQWNTPAAATLLRLTLPPGLAGRRVGSQTRASWVPNMNTSGESWVPNMNTPAANEQVAKGSDGSECSSENTDSARGGRSAAPPRRSKWVA